MITAHKEKQDLKCEYCKKQITGSPVLSLELHGFIAFCTRRCKSEFYEDRINKGLCPSCNIPIINGVCPICMYNAEGMKSLVKHLNSIKS